VASGAPTPRKKAGHNARQAALAATGSFVQKSQIQGADFDIIGHLKQAPNCPPLFRLAGK
jgi:hypothetical protein